MSGVLPAVTKYVLKSLHTSTHFLEEWGQTGKPFSPLRQKWFCNRFWGRICLNCLDVNLELQCYDRFWVSSPPKVYWEGGILLCFYSVRRVNIQFYSSVYLHHIQFFDGIYLQNFHQNSHILLETDFLKSPGSTSYFNAYKLGFCFQQDDVEFAFYHPNGNSKTQSL